jgi:hypothetical protein
MTFGANSRYQTTPMTTLTDAWGTQIVYLQRRLVPQPASFSLLRLDPAELTAKAGRQLRITQQAGIPGMTGA